MNFKIGTRGSKLAITQATWILDQLQQAYPSDHFELVIIKTKGDVIQDRALDKIGDKGIFVKEIEQQLMNGDIDMGVHSMKDMPSLPMKGLVFSNIWKKEDARDVLLLKNAKSLQELPPNAVIATGSKRRSYQLKKLRADISVVPIRGNVDTRIQKMQDGNIDGLIMAAAGLHRLGLKKYITQYFGVDEMIPACAQGALAIELKEDNLKLLTMLNALSDEESTICVQAERKFLLDVNGSCHIPVGANCRKVQDTYEMIALLGDETSEAYVQEKRIGKDPMKVASELAQYLRQKIGLLHE